MGYKYQGDATLGVSLTMQTPKPLDARLVVATRADLYTIDPKYAYNGMAVVCIADGNIYTLLDKTNITEKVSWKASYEAIQIISCTNAEYEVWLKNTNEDFTPKDDTQTYLHEDTYYYIYEESIDDKGQYYVSYSQWEDLTNQVNKKATIASLNNTNAKIQQQFIDLANVYATLGDIDSTDKNSKISKTLEDYYTKTATDDKFVTKESIKGSEIEGDDYVFVTQRVYKEDQQKLSDYQEDTAQQINNRVVIGSDAHLKSVITAGNKLTVGEQAVLNNKPLAFQEEVPKIVVMDQLDYEALGDIDPDVYYMTYGSEALNGGVATSAYLESYYYNQRQIIGILKEMMSSMFIVDGDTLIFHDDTLPLLEVDKPTDQIFDYDGIIHAPRSTDYYDVVGNGGSEPGTYRFKLVLKAGKWWSDGSSVPIFINYTIKAKPSTFGTISFPFEFTNYDIKLKSATLGDTFPLRF